MDKIAIVENHANCNDNHCNCGFAPIMVFGVDLVLNHNTICQLMMDSELYNNNIDKLMEFAMEFELQIHLDEFELMTDCLSYSFTVELVNMDRNENDPIFVISDNEIETKLAILFDQYFDCPIS